MSADGVFGRREISWYRYVAVAERTTRLSDYCAEGAWGAIKYPHSNQLTPFNADGQRPQKTQAVFFPPHFANRIAALRDPRLFSALGGKGRCEANGIETGVLSVGQPFHPPLLRKRFFELPNQQEGSEP